MFEQFDLSLTLDKKEYEEVSPPLKQRVSELQRILRDRKVPLIIVFEGWKSSGITTLISKLISVLDPRGFRVYSVSTPRDVEREHSMMWRFWVKTPAKGQMAIFDRSWYSRVLSERFDITREKEISQEAILDMLTFEHQLADDGVLIIKFFLHISKKEQKKRYEKLENDPVKRWNPSKNDMTFLKKYDALLPIVESVIQKTDTIKSPWTIIEAENQKFAYVKILKTCIVMIESWLNRLPPSTPATPSLNTLTPRTPLIGGSVFSRVDLLKSLSKEEYENEMERFKGSLRDLQYLAFQKKIPVIILFEGWDAAGKGGAIIRLTQALNPRGYVVEPVGVPLASEMLHHYLWRFYMRFPERGSFTIFDRSWYGRVLVERIEGFCSEEDWQRAYHEINDMEERLVSNNNLIIKFWMHIDKDEQIKRFLERENDPMKQYKITSDDWRNREKWDLYEVAVDEMIKKTSTPYAPWTIVESNNKYYSRVKVIRTVQTALQEKITKIDSEKRK